MAKSPVLLVFWSKNKMFNKCIVNVGLMMSQKVTKVIAIHPQGAINAFTKFHANLFDNYHHKSALQAFNINLLGVRQEVTRSTPRHHECQQHFSWTFRDI